ncbi:MAG: LytTR family DNA-binding domain-containing protein [Erysipelotrichaceae bacterium]|nr:LytTR family DNA-binding domain-containing protein [Erysipelotrichaceae bacterium]
MRIAVVDDEECYLEDIQNRINRYKQELFDVDLFYEGKTFLKAYKAKRYDLIYLDIELNVMSDFDIAKTIKNIRKETLIIFITEYGDYYNEKYAMDAFQFMSKPLDDKIFNAELTRAIKYFLNKDKKIAFKTYKGVFIIPIRDIIFLETSYKNYKLHTVDGDHYGSIKQLKNLREKLCENNFMQIHRSFTINFDYIIRIDYHEVYMKNGKIVPISRTKAKEFKRLFTKYLGY